MSVVKNKNNTETETKTTINNKQLRPHITENVGLIEQQKKYKKQLRPHVTENIGLIEQQKFVMIRDRSTSAQNEPPKRLT